MLIYFYNLKVWSSHGVPHLLYVSYFRMCVWSACVLIFHIICLSGLDPLFLSLSPAILSIAWFILRVRLLLEFFSCIHLHFCLNSLQGFYLFIEFCFQVLDCLCYLHQFLCLFCCCWWWSLRHLFIGLKFLCIIFTFLQFFNEVYDCF